MLLATMEKIKLLEGNITSQDLGQKGQKSKIQYFKIGQMGMQSQESVTIMD